VATSDGAHLFRQIENLRLINNTLRLFAQLFYLSLNFLLPRAHNGIGIHDQSDEM